jgi:transcriptional regulator with XRE-family HTH domain
MSAKSPNPIDTYVGGRVRMRRLILAMSQEALAKQLGLTFQQVQKYEKGTNRISASRLQALSQILDVPVHFFFEGVSGFAGKDKELSESPVPNYVADALADSDGHALIRAFSRVKNPALRRSIVRFVERMVSSRDS